MQIHATSLGHTHLSPKIAAQRKAPAVWPQAGAWILSNQ